MTKEEKIRFALQLEEARRVRARIEDETILPATSNSNERPEDVPAQIHLVPEPAFAA